MSERIKIEHPGLTKLREVIMRGIIGDPWYKYVLLAGKDGKYMFMLIDSGLYHEVVENWVEDNWRGEDKRINVKAAGAVCNVIGRWEFNLDPRDTFSTSIPKQPLRFSYDESENVGHQSLREVLESDAEVVFWSGFSGYVEP